MDVFRQDGAAIRGAGAGGGYPLNENNEYVSETPGCSYLILNAVDGSVYDPAVGY